ncbi:MAG TPA: acyltransferase family protein [Jatrophihabitans sp.]|jgi:peptidoglycan/LPS O-acetylase OafA/YrhL
MTILRAPAAASPLRRRATAEARAALTSGRFRPDVQGLRAIAVGSVVLYHGGVSWLGGGYVGVDVFFVISGFLITTHLLRDVLTPGRFSFASFYARRARRILPASLVVNLFTLIAVAVLLTPLDVRAAVPDSIWTALYVPNLRFAGEATNYLAQSSFPSPYQHFWSLGVEEQFYLLWPLLLVLACWAAHRFARRRSRRSVGLVLAAVTLASFVACVRLTRTSQSWAFFSPWTRAWEFAVGGLVALAFTGRLRLPRTAATCVQWAGLAGLVLAIVGYDDRTTFPGVAAALPVLATAALILGGAAPVDVSAAGDRPNIPTRVLSVRPMRFVGEISYSLYLVHWPVLTIAAAMHGATPSLTERLLLVACCVPLAYGLYRWVENPVRRSRRVGGISSRRTLLTALACSVAVIAVSLVTNVVSSHAALTSSRVAGAPKVVRNPSGTSYVPSNLQPSLAAVADDNPQSYTDGCHLAVDFTDPVTNCTFGSNPAAPLVVLFGDSHAAEWFPALQRLANEGKIRLESQTKSGCPSADLPVDWHSGTGPQPYPECPVWRDKVIARLTAAPPALIVLSNYNDPEVPDGGLASASAWSAGISDTVDRLPSTSAIAVLGETPLPGVTPAECLAKHLDDARSCAIDRGAAVDTAKQNAERTATRAANSRYIDLSSYFCNASDCPAIIGNVQVYRDSQHITATFAALMAPVLWKQLRSLL